MFIRPSLPIILLLCFLSLPAEASQELEGLLPDAQGKRNPLVQLEVLNYPFVAQVLDPAFYQRYDSRQIAASLVERKRLFERSWGDYKTLAERPIALDSIEILSFFPDQAIESIIEKGQLNLHQVGHSMGAVDPAKRAYLEDGMIGVFLEDKYSNNRLAAANYVRPKYGLVNFLKPVGIYVNPAQILTSYGDVIVVYKPDVNWRTTYTYGDSLGNMMNTSGALSRDSSRARALVDLQAPDSAHRISKYVEAQVWGALDLSDMQEFRVPEGRSDLVERLKPAGLPVYSYDRADFVLNIYPLEVSAIGLGRQKLLYPGLPGKMQGLKERDKVRRQPAAD